MNLVWNRNTSPKEPQKSSFSCGSHLKDPHWAEMILDQLSQPEDLASAMRDAFPSIKFQDGFEIIDIHHIPGRSLEAFVQFQDLKLDYDCTIIHVIFYPESDCLNRYTKAKGQAIDANRISLVKNWNAVAYIFPEDSGLPHLGEMLNVNKIGACLGEPETNGARWKMLSYKAGVRCAFSYHFPKSGNNYFGKIQNEGETDQNFKKLTWLWENPTRRFNMAQPLQFNPQLGATWESFVTGKNLESMLKGTDLTSIITLVITNLSYLHELDMRPLPALTPDKLTNLIQKKVLRRIHSLVPGLHCRAEEILGKINQNIHYSKDFHNVTLHGDFHIANFLFNHDNFFFLDLDNLCSGSPCYDLAVFGSRLMLRNLLNDDRLTETLHLVGNLPAIYTELSGREVNPDAYAWYLSTCMMARQIKVCMSNAAPNLEFLVSKLLDWSEDCLNSIESPTLNLR